MAGVKDSKTARGRASHASDRVGMVIPTPINNGPVKVYQQPILSGNGPVPANPYKGIVTRSKPLPGEPDNLA